MAIITVNRNTIGSNAKKIKEGDTSPALPPIRIAKNERSGGVYAHEVAILDSYGAEVARFIYNAGDPITTCGARLVLATLFEPKIIEQEQA